MKTVLSITQAANYLGLRERAIADLVDAGNIPYRRIGRDSFFDRDELDAWVAMWNEVLPNGFLRDELEQEDIAASSTHPQYPLSFNSFHDIPDGVKGIYILRYDAYHKIGKSIHAKQRIGELMTIFPEPLEFVHFIETNKHSAFELKLHRMFRKQRIHGEWFRLSPRDVSWLRLLTPALLEELPV